jgi:DNA-binding transcriptional ArsR family regulator
MLNRFGVARRIGEEGPMVAFATVFSEPARAAMVVALMDGRAQTAKELAFRAGVAQSTASFHLSFLESHGLIRRRIQGRHHYFQLSDGKMAGFIEQLMVMAESVEVRGLQTGPKDSTMRLARRCWNHLAGRIAVAIADHLLAETAVCLDGDRFLFTGNRSGFLSDVVGEGATRKVPPCSACLDWSERRPHLGGPAGKSLLSALLEKDMVEQTHASRVLRVTQQGYVLLARHGISLDDTFASGADLSESNDQLGRGS